MFPMWRDWWTTVYLQSGAISWCGFQTGLANRIARERTCYSLIQFLSLLLLSSWFRTFGIFFSMVSQVIQIIYHAWKSAGTGLSHDCWIHENLWYRRSHGLLSPISHPQQKALVSLADVPSALRCLGEPGSASWQLPPIVPPVGNSVKNPSSLSQCLGLEGEWWLTMWTRAEEFWEACSEVSTCLCLHCWGHTHSLSHTHTPAELFQTL